MTKVLIVEDDRLSQLVAKSFLQELACQVDIASTGAEAIEKANIAKYDIILMDIGLGETDGYSVAQKIKTKSVNTSTPIVALTAHNTTECQKLTQEAGMVDFANKPVTQEKLEELLTKHVANTIS